MKSLRERFEEDYAAVSVPAANKDGFKIEYVYYAPWYIWDLPEKRLSEKKKLLAFLSIGSLLIFVLAATRYSGLNTYLPLSLSSVAVLCALVLEIPGVFRFVLAKYRTTRMNFGSADRAVRAGSLIQGAASFAAVVLGMIFISENGFNATDISVLAGFLVSGAAAAWIYREYTRIPVRTEKNAEMDSKREFL